MKILTNSIAKIVFLSSCLFYLMTASGQDAYDPQVLRMPPEYPPHAIAERIEGHVIIEFNVIKVDKVGGIAVNPKIVESVPEDTFDEYALKALNYYRFGSQYINQGKDKVFNEVIYFRLPKSNISDKKFDSDDSSIPLLRVAPKISI